MAKQKQITTESQRTLRKAKSMCGFGVEVRFYLRASVLICVQKKVLKILVNADKGGFTQMKGKASVAI